MTSTESCPLASTAVSTRGSEAPAPSLAPPSDDPARPPSSTSASTEPSPAPGMTVSSRLQREWALCALAAAASRFVPVPMADRAIKHRALRTAVARTWRAHGRQPSGAIVAVLCGSVAGGVARRCCGAVAGLPLALLLFPIRKMVALLTAFTGVWRDLAEVLLLSRAVDRCLANGWLASADPGEQKRQAKLIRRAYLNTVRTTDMGVLLGALKSAVRSVDGWRREAERFAREAFGGRGAITAALEDDDRGRTIDPGSLRVDPAVERGAAEVRGAMGWPGVAAWLARQDAVLDKELALLSKGKGPTVVAVPVPVVAAAA
ncbi:hypothetical protein DFJ74DRAFT_772904 [Hyaloraphidium curvatum]|nr:hypothetical protein DFJ74DRAFT_772904 [Hyaloraphidium curvatum]